MYQQRVSTSESPRVEVTSCQGNLAVTTGDNSEILIEAGSKETLTVEERDGAVALVANSDCNLTVPAGASLAVVQLQGDLSVQGVGGSVDVTTVQGDARFKSGAGNASLGAVQGDLVIEDWAGSLDVGTVQGDAWVKRVNGAADFGAVGGDLSAEVVDGPLAARSVAGDAYLRQLNAPLSVGDVGADLVGRAWMAGADVAQVGGDVSLKTVFAGPFAYNIQARGDITVKTLPGSSATFVLRAVNGRVRAKGLTGEMTEDRWQGIIGDGEAQVTLTSTHGNVTLKAVEESDKDRGAFAFAAEVGGAAATAGLAGEELAQRIQQRVAERLSKIDFEAIARREAEHAHRQAERETEKARRVAEKARRRAERARKKAERKVQWRLERDGGHGTRRTPRQSQGVSDQERVAILSMLAEGKISAQEAEILLQALEG